MARICSFPLRKMPQWSCFNAGLADIWKEWSHTRDSLSSRQHLLYILSTKFTKWEEATVSSYGLTKWAKPRSISMNVSHYWNGHHSSSFIGCRDGQATQLVVSWDCLQFASRWKAFPCWELILMSCFPTWTMTSWTAQWWHTWCV